MNRRGLIVVLGAAAVGNPAVLDSEAFSSVTASRNVDVRVADDAAAFVTLLAPNSLENGEYATDSNEGATDTLRLNFDGTADVDGDGLNPDAVSRFDSVFRIVNRGTQFMRFGIDRSGLDEPDRWRFIAERGGGPDPFGTWDEPDNVGPGLQPGDSFTVGVEIDTRGAVESLGGGRVVIQAEARP